MTHALPGLLVAASLAAPAAANALGDDAPRPALPKALHGVFATDAASCRNRRSDGRIEVTATEIRFYESTARPDQLLELPDGGVVIWADVEGEGKSWGELIGLVPTAGGLVRHTASDGHAAQGRIAYVRCPAPRK